MSKSLLSFRTGGDRRVLVEVASDPLDTDETDLVPARRGSRREIVREADEELRQVVEGLRDVLKDLDTALEAAPSRLHEIEVAFHVRIQGGATLAVVSGESEATFSILARWKLR